MTYSPELLAEAERWGELPFQVEELAILLDFPVAELRLALSDPDDDLSRAIRRGQLRAKGEFYEAVQKLSNNGSGPAQALLSKLMGRIDT